MATRFGRVVWLVDLILRRDVFGYRGGTQQTQVCDYVEGHEGGPYSELVAALLILRSFLAARGRCRERAGKRGKGKGEFGGPPSYNQLLTSESVAARSMLRARQYHPEGPMPEHIKKRLEEEIKLLEHELTTELPQRSRRRSRWAT